MISGVHSILLVLSVSNNLLEDLFFFVNENYKVLNFTEYIKVTLHIWKNKCTLLQQEKLRYDLVGIFAGYNYLA